ncbi:MAG: TIGR01244 family phosphatase, partial [Sphingomonadales bacterium]|nr:TIGR01244 family phosphatase [Sphingomonadales bacterium]
MTPLDDRFYVSAHLDLDGIEKACCLGFTMVINNRPDHED